MNKKKIWIPIVAAVLVIAIVAGIGAVSLNAGESVPVYAVSMLSYTSAGTGSGESYGVVAADRVQSIYVSDTQTVTRLCVSQGQQVRQGDLLYTYDTTLSDLTLEKKDLAIQQMEINLKNAKAELTQLNAMKPMVVTTTGGNTSSNTKYDKSPASRDDLDSIYGGSGTAGDPYRYWISENTPLYEDLIWEIIDYSERTQVYVVFQLTENDKTNTEFDAQYGVRFDVLEVEEEPDPTGPSESTEPSETTDPGESTGPTDDPDGSGGTIAPQSEQSEPEETTEQSGQSAVAAYQRSVERVYAMSFFDPEEDVQEATTSINWNSGYTQAELVSMREEKAEEIETLEFNIKMGKAELEIMKKEASDGCVYAEFDGTVVSVLEPDNARSLNQPMLKITGGGGYYVEGTVSELALDTIQPGLTVKVNCWETGMTYTGTVTQIGSYPSEEAGYSYGTANVSYYPFKVFVDENADLQEGAFVSLTYQTGSGEDVLYLESAFIRSEGKESYVWVRNGEGLLEKRYIETGTSPDGYATPVYSGLTESDYIAFPYGRDVREGAQTVESGVESLYGS